MLSNETRPQLWGGWAFEKICELWPELDAAGRPIECRPQARYAKAANARLHGFGAGPFCRFHIPNRLPFAGVYLIVDRGGRAIYVGESVHLSRRFNMGYGNISPRNCYVGGQSTNCKVNALVLRSTRRGERLELWFLPTAQRKAVEMQLIRELRPPWNAQVP